MTYLLALDQGTSSSRSILFDARGGVVAVAQRELPQIYPQPGWVEHDPMRIWHDQLATAQQVLQQAGVRAEQLQAVGVTNQRETTVLWDRCTGEPVHPAIVWQDRRAESVCARWRAQGLAERIAATTGLVIDAYFSAPKLVWLLEHVPGLRVRAERGELAFGTIDSWLLWQLTGGQVHATDVSNASRTQLFDIHHNRWSESLLQAMDIPQALLPQVHPSAHRFGQVRAELLGAAVPIGGMAGDQQSSLVGQAGFAPGLAKNTYGTGCFMLMPVGHDFGLSAHGLVTTSAAQPDPQVALALEGSVFVGGAVVQWLRDGLGLIRSSDEIEALARSVDDSGGVCLVPAFTGLGAPYWQPDARGTIVGLSRGSTRAHIARAALESIAFQSAALFDAMAQDAASAGLRMPTELRVDGGAARNDLLMQMQADLLGIEVVRPKVTETTALGAAYLAGLGTGLYSSTEEIAALWQAERRFEPAMDRVAAQNRLQAWAHAVRQTVAR
jgi:glycerol kinase